MSLMIFSYLVHFGEVGPQQRLALPPLIRQPLLHKSVQLLRQSPLPLIELATTSRTNLIAIGWRCDFNFL